MKELINSKLLELPSLFHDPIESLSKKGDLEKEYGLESKNLFSSQRVLDLVKNQMTKTEFNMMVSAYLSQFIRDGVFDFPPFDKEVKQNHQTMKRHLGKGYMAVFALLIRFYKESNKKTQGLLGNIDKKGA